MLDNWQERTQLLLGKKHEYIQNSNVAIFGLGGVGGIAAEMMCRAGINKMTIIDGDNIDITNLNRQIITNKNNIGNSKAKTLANRLLSINPNIKLNIISEYIEDNEMQNILICENYDYVIDAIDTLSPKVQLIYKCVTHNIPIVSSMGAGAKLDPTLVQVADIQKSYNCTLARIVRKRLHRLGIRTGVKVVFSSEKSITESVRIFEQQNKKTTVGTISYMPSIFGIYCAWVVIDELMNAKL